MSDMKSIWRSKNEMPQANKDVVEHWINCYDEHCYSMWKQRPDGGSFDSHTIAWCYLDDLLALETELERTRKALDVAVDGLLAVWRATDCTTKQGSIAYNVLRDLNIKPLDQIKELEQKDK